MVRSRLRGFGSPIILRHDHRSVARGAIAARAVLRGLLSLANLSLPPAALTQFPRVRRRAYVDYSFRLQSINLAALTIYLSQLPDRGDVDAIAARDAVIGLARLEPDLDFLLLLRRQLVWLAWSLW